MASNDRSQEPTAFLRLFEFAPDAMIAVDGAGKIVLVNAQTETMFGYEGRELLGQTMELLVPKRYREAHAGHRAKYAGQPRVRPMGAGLDLFALRKDGTEFPVEISLGPMETPEGKLIVAAVRDVTEQKLAREFLKKAQAELEAEVSKRTEELRAANRSLRQEIAERRRLEDLVLTISEEEKRRIGQDLHDDLGQNLLGIALMAKLLEERFEGRSAAEANPAREIARRANEAIQKARDLARGLFPVTVNTGGLVGALQELAANVESHSGVLCLLDSDEAIELNDFKDGDAALQIFRIAQEALNNAIKHGRPKRVLLKLRSGGRGLELSIEDDGAGLPDAFEAGKGMGLKVMRYRAGRMGATLEIRRRPEGGTSVVCRLARP